MAIPDYWDPMREWSVAIPQKSDGSGVVGLFMRAGNMQHFKLDQFPRPKDHGITYPGSEYVFGYAPFREGGANNGNFRIAYEHLPGRQKPSMARFRLKGPWVMDTLAVITNYLNAGDVPWMYIANEFGNAVSHGCFRSTVEWGGERNCS